MTTITWAVTAMNAYPQEAGNTDVVFNIHWTCSGVQDEFSASIYNTTQVPTPEGSFTPFAALTQEQVLGWIWGNGVDKAATEAAVQQQINNQINPPVVTPKLPWITT